MGEYDLAHHKRTHGKYDLVNSQIILETFGPPTQIDEIFVQRNSVNVLCRLFACHVVSISEVVEVLEQVSFLREKTTECNDESHVQRCPIQQGKPIIYSGKSYLPITLFCQN